MEGATMLQLNLSVLLKKFNSALFPKTDDLEEFIRREFPKTITYYPNNPNRDYIVSALLANDHTELYNRLIAYVVQSPFSVQKALVRAVMDSSNYNTALSFAYFTTGNIHEYCQEQGVKLWKELRPQAPRVSKKVILVDPSYWLFNTDSLASDRLCELFDNLQKRELLTWHVHRDFACLDGVDHHFFLVTESWMRVAQVISNPPPFHQISSSILPTLILMNSSTNNAILNGKPCLPSNRRPIQQWTNMDGAWIDVENGILKILGAEDSITVTSPSRGEQKSSITISSNSQPTKIPQYTITILHLSDLHERGTLEVEPWRRRLVLKSLLPNIAEIQKEMPIDLVCFTGDLADTGKAEEYEAAAKFLNSTLEVVGLSRDRFFIIPGNHDIERDRTPEAKIAWAKIRDIIDRIDPLEMSRWLVGGKAPLGVEDRWREALLSRAAAFHSFLRNFGLADLLPENSPHKSLGYRSSIVLPNVPFKTYIIGLNSAWLSGDKHDAGKLLLTENQVMSLCTDSVGDPLVGLRLALVHHPLSDLLDGTRCRRLLAEHVNLLLHGHLHDPEPQLWENPDRRLRQFATGCLYDSDRGDHYPNAYTVVRIICDGQGHPLEYDLRFLEYSQRGWHWFQNGGLYREARGGRLRLTA